MAWKEFRNVALSSYQVWRLGWAKLTTLLLFSTVAFFAFKFVGPEYFYTMALAGIGLTLMAILYFHREEFRFSFSINPWKHRPKKVLQTTVTLSFVFVFNLINLFAQLIPLLLESSPYQQFTPIVFLILGSLLIAMTLTIYQSINLKTLKLIKP